MKIGEVTKMPVDRIQGLLDGVMAGKIAPASLSDSDKVAVKSLASTLRSTPSAQQPLTATTQGQQTLKTQADQTISLQNKNKKKKQAQTQAQAVTFPPQTWGEQIGGYLAQNFPKTTSAIAGSGELIGRAISAPLGGVNPFTTMGASSSIVGDIAKNLSKPTGAEFQFNAPSQFAQGVKEYYKDKPWYASPTEAINAGFEGINKASEFAPIQTVKNIYARNEMAKGATAQQGLDAAEKWVRENPNLAGTIANVGSAVLDPMNLVGGGAISKLVRGVEKGVAEQVAKKVIPEMPTKKFTYVPPVKPQIKELPKMPTKKLTFVPPVKPTSSLPLAERQKLYESLAEQVKYNPDVEHAVRKLQLEETLKGPLPEPKKVPTLKQPNKKLTYVPPAKPTPPSGWSLTNADKQALYTHLAEQADKNPEIKRLVDQLEISKAFENLPEYHANVAKKHTEIDAEVKNVQDQLDKLNASHQKESQDVANTFWNRYVQQGKKQPKTSLDEMVKSHGYIRTPVVGDFHYDSYKTIPDALKRKYFRKDAKYSIDEFANDAVGQSANDFLDQLNHGKFPIMPEDQWIQDFTDKYGHAPTKSKLVEFFKEQADQYGVNAEHNQNVKALQDVLDELKKSKSELPSIPTKEAPVTKKPTKSSVVKTKPSIPAVAEDGYRARIGGVPSQSQLSAQIAKTVTKENVMNTLRNELGVTIRTGRMQQARNLLGINKTKPEVTRTATHGDIQTIAHEVGHSLDTRYDLSGKADQQELINFVNNYSPYHLANYPDVSAHIPEAIAEYFRAYLTDKNVAKSMAPKFTDLIEKTLSKKEFSGLEKSAKVTEQWNNQTSAVDRIKEHILSGEAPKQNKWMSFAEKKYEQTVDRFIALGKAGLQVLNPELRGKSNLDVFMKHGEGLHPESMSAYEQARRYEGTPRITRNFLDQNLKPIMKELEKAKISLEDLTAYATSKHANDLHDIAKSKGVANMPDGSNPLTGLKDSDVKGAIVSLETPEMKKIHKMLLSYNQKLLDIAYKGGFISEKTRDMLLNRYPNYVPFQRFFSESAGEANFAGTGSQKSFADIYSPIKRFKGSTRTIKDPLESMVSNAHSIIDAVERNKVGQAVAKLYDNQGAGFFVERLGVKARQEIAKGVRKENIITVMENGKRVLYQVNPDIYKVLQNINPKSAEFVEKYASKVANVMRGAISLTPKFVIKQLLVDDWNTMMVSDKRFFIPYVDTIKGLGVLLKEPAVVDRWVKSGGAYGGMFSQDPRYIQAAIDEMRTDKNITAKVTKFVRITPKVLRHLIEAPTEARSLITFKKLTEGKGYGSKKYTDEQAAYIARDLMDFQRRGSAMHGISRSTPFFNANIQAKDKTIRALRQNWKQFAIKGAVSMTLPSIAIYYYNRNNANAKQKQAINEAPDWLKNTNYLIAVPGTDIVARFPKPYDSSWAFANGAEEVVRRIEKDNPKALDDFAKENLINDALPQLFSPALIAIGAMANYDFHTGAPIVGKSLQSLPKPEQYDASSSKLSKLLGETFNLSPKTIDYVTKGYFGDYATIGNKILDSTFLNNTYKDVDNVPKDDFWKNYLGVNTLIYPEGKYQPQSITNFYDNFNKIEKDFNMAKRKGQDYGSSNLYKDVIGAYKYINREKNQIKDIQFDKTMSIDAKKSAIDRINEDMLKIAQEVNKKVKNAEVK